MNSSYSCLERKTQGAPCMSHLSNMRHFENKMIVGFNNLNQPLGDSETQMRSFLGVITCQNVPVNMSDLCKVSKS